MHEEGGMKNRRLPSFHVNEYFNPKKAEKKTKKEGKKRKRKRKRR